MKIGIFPCGLISLVASYYDDNFTTVCINELIWFEKRVYIRSNTSDCLYIMPQNVNHSCSLIDALVTVMVAIVCTGTLKFIVND